MNELRISSPFELKQAIEQLSKLDSSKAWRVTVKQWREKRSLSQNALAAMWYKEFSEAFSVKAADDMPPEEVAKTWLKIRFLGFKEYNIGGQIVSLPRRTRDLDLGEMTHYMEQIQSLCASKGVFLTVPENSQYMELIRSQDR